MDSDQLRLDVERFALDSFAFLVEECRFRQGRTERNVWYTNTYYLGADLGISVMVQYLDPEIQVDLIKTYRGKRLPHWGQLAISSRWSRPFRFAVQNVLHVTDDRIAHVSQLHRTPQPWASTIFEGILSAYSGMVKDHLGALQAYSPDVLFPERSTTS